jgi:hypothetical protein
MAALKPSTSCAPCSRAPTGSSSRWAAAPAHLLSAASPSCSYVCRGLAAPSARWVRRPSDGGPVWRCHLEPAIDATRSNARRSCGGAPPTSGPAPRLGPLGMLKQHRGSVSTRAGAVDIMPAWTLDQIVGLVFGVRLRHTMHDCARATRPAKHSTARPRPTPPTHPTRYQLHRLAPLAPAQFAMLAFVLSARQVCVAKEGQQGEDGGNPSTAPPVRRAATCG